MQIWGGGISSLKAKYVSFFNDLKLRCDKYTSLRIFVRGEMLLAASNFKRHFQWPDILTGDGGSLIEMANGHLTDIIEEVSNKDIEEIANSVADFVRFLSSEGIDFLFVNIGNKVSPQDEPLINRWGQRNFSNVTSDKFLQALQIRAINTLDLRSEMLKPDFDWYGAYFLSDGHWTNVAQLWAASVIANKLNKDHGFHFDLSYFDKNNYDCTVYKKIFLGGYGVAKADLRYLEDFEMLLPRFKTEFEINVPLRKLHRTGGYKDTLVDLELLEKIIHYSNADFLGKPTPLSVAQIRNDAQLSIINKKTTHNNGKKLLMLIDSFGAFLTGYLAMDVPEMDDIYLLDFGGSIRTYIRQTRPDMVILMYYAGNIKPIDWAIHTSPFDLR